ncbi:MAG: response regulator [Cytophagales bacterium]|nr:response regulator [Cytophagales bacterium]
MKKTILVVDDHIDITRMVINHLSAQDKYLVLNANNGEMACQIAIERQPDLILMDWDMPVMSGVEATRRLKNTEETFDIPVIISTGRMTSSDDLKVALEAGAVDYIRKPIDFVELDARVNTAIRIKEQNEAIKTLLQQDIELKNRKLSTASMLIVEKNGLLQDFSTELQKIETEVNKGSQDLSTQLKNLRKRVNNHLDIDNSWETFRLHFDEVHPDFFNALTSQFQNLSHKDLKLSAYLKMGLDNKQIAQLLNITPSSTRTALTRLKQKMGLEEEINLRAMIGELG